MGRESPCTLGCLFYRQRSLRPFANPGTFLETRRTPAFRATCTAPPTGRRDTEGTEKTISCLLRALCVFVVRFFRPPLVPHGDRGGRQVGGRRGGRLRRRRRGRRVRRLRRGGRRDDHGRRRDVHRGRRRRDVHGGRRDVHRRRGHDDARPVVVGPVVVMVVVRTADSHPDEDAGVGRGPRQGQQGQGGEGEQAHAAHRNLLLAPRPSQYIGTPGPTAAIITAAAGQKSSAGPPPGRASRPRLRRLARRRN